MKIDSLVQLYRSSQNRVFKQGVVSGAVPCVSGLPMIESVVNSGCGRLVSAFVDGVEIDVDYLDDAPADGRILSYRIKAHTGSLSTFHENIATFLGSGSEVSRGLCPDEYYIVDIDAYSEDAEPHWVVRSLATACRAISLLAKVAHYHDSKSDTGSLQLVFIDTSSDKSIKPILINTVVSSSIISICQDIDLTLLEQMASAAPESDPHFSSRQGVFYTTVSEFLGGSSGIENNFEQLLSNWKVFANTFQANLNTYVSGFAFHKAKREVAEAEFNIADQYAKVLGDITGKLLAIPVSFAALVALSKTESLLEGAFLVIGLTFASLVVSGIIHNQRRHFSLIKQAKNIVIDSIDGKADSYPQDLRDSIDKMKTSLVEDEAQLQWTLRALHVVAWIPAILSVAYLCHNL